MKHPARLTQETEWVDGEKRIIHPAGTECSQLAGDLSEYGDRDVVGQAKDSIERYRRRDENWTAILLTGFFERLEIESK